MQTILGDILTWPWFSERHGYNFNGFLIPDASGNLCIDPVEMDDATLDELGRRGLHKIIVTNRNHVRAANRVRERTGARTAIHPMDREYAKGQGAIIDEDLQIGDRIGPLHVVGVAGKSSGEVALHWPERKILIVGDAIIGNPPGKCGLLRESVMDNPSQLKQSIRKLLELNFDTMLVGDGVPILIEAKSRLKDLVATFS